MRLLSPLIGLSFTLTFAGSLQAHAQTTHYDYDAQGRLLEVDDSEIGEINYSYDAAGNITNRTVVSGGTQGPPSCANPHIVGLTGSQTSVTTDPRVVCSDPDGDTLQITGASITGGAGGASVNYNSTQLIFSNVPCFETFAQFTVSDGNGNSATGQVEIYKFNCSGGGGF